MVLFDRAVKLIHSLDLFIFILKLPCNFGLCCKLRLVKQSGSPGRGERGKEERRKWKRVRRKMELPRQRERQNRKGWGLGVIIKKVSSLRLEFEVPVTKSWVKIWVCLPGIWGTKVSSLGIFLLYRGSPPCGGRARGGYSCPSAGCPGARHILPGGP